MVDDAEARVVRAGVASARRQDKSRKAALAPLSVRIFESDLETLQKVGERHDREVSYLVRLAVHMLCEALRKNPRAMDV